MRISTRFAFALVAALIAMATGVFIGLEARQERPSDPPLLPAEAITRLFATRLSDTEGKSQAIAQWQGKTLVVNFWATWCPPCREEMPSFSRLHGKYAANGVQFVGIALDTPDNVISFSQRHPVVYPLLIADPAATELTRLLGNSTLSLPYTVVLDTQGTPQLARLGRVSELELDNMLHKLTLP